MNRPHLIRMLMVNSGKKALVDIDFKESLHLHGRNNAGKTTFVNALQFCFTDKYSSMAWDGHSKDETRRHYFSESSYIVFTVWTEFGLQNLLLVGYGAARMFRFQRWVFPGDLDEKLLYSNQDGRITPRSTIDVERDLQLIPGSRKINETEMKGWIDGSGDSPFGLIPLKRSGKFSDFRKLFNNLLRLNKLDSNEIKSLIINCTSAIPSGNESINLRAEFREAYLEHKSKRHEIEVIERNRHLLEQFLSHHSSLVSHRSQYAGLFMDVQPKIAPYLVKLQLEIAALEQELGGRQETRTKMMERKGELQSEMKNLVGDQALATNRMDEVKSSIREAEAASQLELTSELATIDTDERVLQAAISTGEYESIGALKSREKEIQQSITRLEGLIAGGTNLGIDILTELGAVGSENILKLLSDNVRSLPPASYKFGGDGSFSGMVQTSEAADLTIGDLTINLDSVPSISVPQTMEELETAKAKKQADHERVKSAIDAVEKREETQRKLKNLRKKRDELTRVLKLIESLPESKQSLKEIEANLKVIIDRLEVIHHEVNEIDEKLIQFEKDSTDIQDKLNQKKGAKSRIEQRFGDLPLPDSDWSKSVQNEFRENLSQAIEHLFERFDSLQASESTVEKSRLVLHSATEGIYQAEDLATEVDSVTQVLDSLKNLKELLAKNEVATQTIMQERISTFLASLDSVRRMVQQISKELREVQISNIDSFSLHWVERRSRIGKAMKSLRKQTKIFDFENSDQVDDLVSYLFEQEQLHLSDFFDLSLKVKIDERVKEYDRIERIESKGTSLGILICIHVVLLKHMTKESRGRLPIFIDEVEKLDSNNIRSIVNFCESNGFLVITASPRPNTLPRIQYWLDRSPFTNSSHRQDWGIHDGEE